LICHPVNDASIQHWKYDLQEPQNSTTFIAIKGKGKGFPILDTERWPTADPGVQAVSPQVTVSHPPGGNLPLLSARPAVTFPAAEYHHPLSGTKL